MRLWEALPIGSRINGEEVLWEGRAAVMSGVMLDDDVHPIDVAGVDIGFAVLTNMQLVIGNLSRFRQRPKPWYRFDLKGVTGYTENPKGVAFSINHLGAVNFVLVSPPWDVEGLRRVAESLSGPSSVPPLAQGACTLIPILPSQPGGDGSAVATEDGIVIELDDGTTVEFGWQDIRFYSPASLDKSTRPDAFHIAFGPGRYDLLVESVERMKWLSLLDQYGLPLKQQ